MKSTQLRCRYHTDNTSMTVSWKSLPTFLHICLLLCTTGAVIQQFQLEPANQTVLQGSDVKFNATVQGQWLFMTWSVGDNLVLTVPVESNGTSSLPQFSAKFCSTGDPSCVEFTIHNVNRSTNGLVTCSVQGAYGSKTAQFNVQESGTVNILGGNVTADQDQQVEFQCVTTAWFPIPTVSWTQNSNAIDSSLYNTSSMADGDLFNSTSVLKFQAVKNTTVECCATLPALTNPLSSSVSLVVVPKPPTVPKPPDWTVLIAVVVSFGGAALLALLILGIIFCCNRRKEKQSNYQDEMSRRVRTQSQLSTVSEAALRRGQANRGFEPEGQTSVSPSELTDSGSYQANGPIAYQMPDILNGEQTGNGYNSAQHTLDGSGFRKHRHLTFV
ncbi:immunoglobulin superfamily member 5 isoform X1 [Platichthys flesus]|uniref:immunoglobulin superfamily member 5 isoform X1 n=1 Tax=Platichthys flesus TaxID=8260 RepID=UPI002DB6D280|nr:immunoglobulin superfamily member 5 isoform X1 [Platichthys flesus]